MYMYITLLTAIMQLTRHTYDDYKSNIEIYGDNMHSHVYMYIDVHVHTCRIACHIHVHVLCHIHTMYLCMHTAVGLTILAFLAMGIALT